MLPSLPLRLNYGSHGPLMGASLSYFQLHPESLIWRPGELVPGGPCPVCFQGNPLAYSFAYILQRLIFPTREWNKVHYAARNYRLTGGDEILENPLLP